MRSCRHSNAFVLCHCTPQFTPLSPQNVQDEGVFIQWRQPRKHSEVSPPRHTNRLLAPHWHSLRWRFISCGETLRSACAQRTCSRLETKAAPDWNIPKGNRFGQSTPTACGARNCHCCSGTALTRVGLQVRRAHRATAHSSSPPSVHDVFGAIHGLQRDTGEGNATPPQLRPSECPARACADV